mmetsp:Transcript_73285/g.201253  ORF Transcript_73285/g.201253 Transcript_73285/m.201253 type:complete len:212 (+) Transcript_73285:419-1054(+)
MAGECQKMSRAQLAEDLLVESIAFVPVLGGVIEYGTTHGPSTATWTSEEDAFRQIIPNEEIEMAISEGATYIIFWKGDVKAGTYNVGAAFERPANKLSVVKDTGESYITKSGETTLAFDGVGPVAVCGRAGSVLEVKDTATCARPGRRLARVTAMPRPHSPLACYQLLTLPLPSLSDAGIPISSGARSRSSGASASSQCRRLRLACSSTAR